MTVRIFTDRSRIIAAQRCPRFRFLQYHQDGSGIVPARTPLPLAVGTSVHEGLAMLLTLASTWLVSHPMADVGLLFADPIIRVFEDEAVREALADFSRHQSALTLDAGEIAAMTPTAAAKDFQSQVVAQAVELGMDSAQIGQLGSDPAAAQGEFDRYLYAEQSALVDGMVRAYARRRLRPLLEQFEVLEVEREGEWKLTEWEGAGDHDWYSPSDDPDSPWYDTCSKCSAIRNSKAGMGPCRYGKAELWFMSRPDALLRERTTNELYLLSYKTTATWDVRKARDIEHDMQGLSEGVEVERRLEEWWRQLHDAKLNGSTVTYGLPDNMVRFLRSLEAAPRIHAIRYEHLLKGERWKDKELSARLGIEVRSQKSPLVRQYVAVSVPKKGDGGYRVGDVCVSWDYYRVEDDRDGSLSWQNWKSRPVWEEVQYSRAVNSVPSGIDSSLSCIKDWIDRLDSAELLMSGEDSTVGLQPRPLGWRSDAQAMGVTKEHPLDAVFVPPVTIYRNDDDLRDWVESTEHLERTTAEGVAAVAAASDEGEKRHLLNTYFPQFRHSCSYPSECAYVRICFGGSEIKNDPLAVAPDQFKRREPNHPQELVQIK